MNNNQALNLTDMFNALDIDPAQIHALFEMNVKTIAAKKLPENHEKAFLKNTERARDRLPATLVHVCAETFLFHGVSALEILHELPKPETVSISANILGLGFGTSAKHFRYDTKKDQLVPCAKPPRRGTHFNDPAL